jgi:hypothetical protein
MTRSTGPDGSVLSVTVRVADIFLDLFVLCYQDFENALSPRILVFWLSVRR